MRYINGVTQEESDHLLQWFLDLVYKNHDLQVRLKWQNKNDIGSCSFIAIVTKDSILTRRQQSGTTAVFFTRQHSTITAWATDSEIERWGSESTSLQFRLSTLSILHEAWSQGQIIPHIRVRLVSRPAANTKTYRRPYLDPESSSRRVDLGIPFVQ